MTSTADNTQQNASTNANYTGASVISIRLETQGILDQLECFLRGAQLVPHEVEGEGIVMKPVKTGEPKVNDQGVQSLMSFIQAVINPQVVQGNFTEDQYNNFIYELNVSLVRNVIINSDTWRVEDEDIGVICDFVMALVIPFLSRTIDNKERESYETTLRSTESNTVQTKRLPFGSSKGG